MRYDDNNPSMRKQGFPSAQREPLTARHYEERVVSSRLFWAAIKSTLTADVEAVLRNAEGEQEAQLRRNRTGAKLALTARVDELCGGVLQRDLSGDARFANFIHPEQRQHTEMPSSQNLWISQPGVTTSWHYDTYTNFFVHLQGSKRVLLLPPSAHDHLHFYPSLHPLYRKSRLIWEEYEDWSTARMSSRFPGWADHEPIQAVTLEPGDILYIPPYWNHRVETLGTETSASLSFWSSSDASMLSTTLLNLVLTSYVRIVNAGYGESRGLDFFQAVIHQVVETLLPAVEERRRFFDTLVHRQYGPELSMGSSSSGRGGTGCKPCEPPLSFEAADEEAAFVRGLIDETASKMVEKATAVTASLPVDSKAILRIVLGFVIEKGLNKLFFEDVRTDVCFMLKCFSEHLTRLRAGLERDISPLKQPR